MPVCPVYQSEQETSLQRLLCSNLVSEHFRNGFQQLAHVLLHLTEVLVSYVTF